MNTDPKIGKVFWKLVTLVDVADLIGNTELIFEKTYQSKINKTLNSYTSARK